jgi:hypothetical protein
MEDGVVGAEASAKVEEEDQEDGDGADAVECGVSVRDIGSVGHFSAHGGKPREESGWSQRYGCT